MNVRAVVLILGLFSVLSTAAGGYLYYNSARKSALKETEKDLVATNEALKDDVVRLVSFNQDEVRALAGFEQFQETLADPQDKDALLRANRVLDHFAEGLAYDVCFLIDSFGNCIGSSNRNRPDSFVGHAYRFRQYFKDAIQGRPNVELALGIVTGIRGIFLSHPVYSSDGAKPIGVVVIKVSTQALDRVFSRTRNMIALLVNRDGMIFVSSRKNWILNFLWKLPPLELARIKESGQFGKGPWDWTGLEKKADDQASDSSGADYTIREMSLENCPGWRIVSLYSYKGLSEKIFDPLVGKTGYIALILCLMIGGAVVVLYVMAQRDIYSRKMSEEALHIERDRAQMYLDVVGVMVIALNVEGLVVLINKKGCELLGYKEEEILNKNWFDVCVRQEIREETKGFFEKLLSGVRDSVEYYENPVLTKVGEERIIAFHYSLIRDQTSSITGVLFSGEDVTERNKTMESLKLANEFQHRLLSTAATAIVVIDPDRIITSVNDEFCLITGFSLEEVVGHPRDIFAIEECESNCSLYSPERSGPIFRQNSRIRNKSGQLVSILKNADLMLDESGKVVGGIESFIDVTELIEAREKALAANVAKSAFLANMSHEIRTPMNGIIGMTELALNTCLTEEQREYMEAVKISAESLLRLINDILDFSKIEAGKFELVEVDFSLRDSIAQAMMAVSLQAHTKDLELVYHIPPHIPDIVVGDPGRLNQILINLMGNAIKFTYQGEVAVDIQLESESEYEIHLHFLIKDTGIGIPKDKQQKIFDAFEQADGSTTRKFGGTGLGLAVSAQLVQMMGGQIWLESEVGTGSTFHFTTKLGLSRRPLPLSATVDFSEFKDLPVLIVDDNAMNRFVIKEILTYWGMRPVAVESATEALKTMRNAQELGQPFSLVLIDYLMPDINGFELAERINQDHSLSGVTMIMLTSAGQRGDARRCMNVGIAAYCLKPIKQSELFAVISTALNKSSEGERRPSLVTRHSVREVKKCLSVLLAEDNAINQKLATRILQKMGHTVTIAENGKEALHILKNTHFDIILMDVQMPEMDGFEVTRFIREKERIIGGHISILAMTAHAMSGDREKCLAAGMDGYVSKPINTQELVENIEKLVDKREVDSEAPSAAGQGGDIIDKAQLLARVGGDLNLLRELVDLFLDTGTQMLSQVEQSVGQGDAGAIERAAHTMKGVVGNFAANRAFEAALKLETMGREGSLKHADRAFRDLEREINLFTDVLVSLKKNNFQDILPCH